MCGIIGYTGNGDAVPKLTEGLSVLEYRGYDSVGIAAVTDAGVKVVKCRGRIGDLRTKLEAEPPLTSSAGIGHTRWATHGGPSDVNAHPHRVGSVTLVHNGIIENYRALRRELEQTGASFLSETDTEVAAALIDRSLSVCGDPLTALRDATGKMTGSYAFALLCDGHPDELFAARSGSPLILGKGTDGCYLASDLTALLPFTDVFCPLGEGQTAHITRDGAAVFGKDGTPVPVLWQKTTMTPETAQKGGFPHFMAKEIHEQPTAIVNALSPRVKNGLPDFSTDGIPASFFRSLRSIRIVACGSAMHAGLVGARLMEDLAHLPAEVSVASEYRYHPPVASEGSAVIVISQSGETADSLAALRYAKSVGIPTLAIVNAVESTIAREADYRVYTYAGPEIAVATTKGYTTQVAALYLLAAAVALERGALPENDARRITRELLCDVPEAVRAMLKNGRNTFRTLAEQLASREHIFYIGRGTDSALSMEGALKLKEISYIHAEAYAAGELKHGTISLIEAGTPVIAVCTERELYGKTVSNVREVSGRGAHVILLCRDDAETPEQIADDVILLPSSSSAALFSAVTAMQMLAYETAALRGCDIDRPRNLAKSVTVE